MSNRICRFANQNDLAQLVELRILMQREVSGSGVGGMDPDYPEALRSFFAEGLTQGSYLSAVAEADGRLIAANGLIIYRKPPSITGGLGRVGYVSNVYTRQEWRGRGIASELMGLIVARAKEIGLDKLHLGATESGLGVYERVGFKATRFPQLELRL